MSTLRVIGLVFITLSIAFNVLTVKARASHDQIVVQRLGIGALVTALLATSCFFVAL